MEEVRPNYYRFEIGGKWIDVFDVARAMNLPHTLFMAFKYFRVKGDRKKRINDLQKAIECIRREIDYLENEENENK